MCDRKIGPFDCCSIVCGDCLELMKQLPDGCVDAVITDPPYPNLKGGYVYNFPGVAATRSYRSVGDPWNASLEWVRDAKRICRFGSAVFCTHHSVTDLALAFEDFRQVALLTWYKRNSPPTGANVPRFTSEFIWCFAKQPGLKWDAIDDTVLDIPKLQAGCMATERLLHADGTCMHPTQKPEAVMLWLLKIGGEILIDPFSGSGTTLVAAKKLGRHFLGFEIDENYCSIARKRLDAIDAQPSLFAPKPEQLTLGGDDRG
jgi:modification methylase